MAKGGEVSSDDEACHGVAGSELWTVYKGWRIYLQETDYGLSLWKWSIRRDKIARYCFADDRWSAEQQSMQAIDEIEREQQHVNCLLIQQHVADLIDAVESVQDWNGTHVGDMIDAVA